MFCWPKYIENSRSVPEPDSANSELFVELVSVGEEWTEVTFHRDLSQIDSEVSISTTMAQTNTMG